MKAQHKCSWLKRLLFGEKDWELVWEDFTEFEAMFILRTTEWETVKAYYRIYFSPSRNRYKLKLEGFPHGRENKKYQEALDKLNHFKNQLQ